MINKILKLSFYFSICYLVVYFVSMLSGDSGFWGLPMIFVSYIGLCSFLINVFALLLVKMRNSKNRMILYLFVLMCILHISHIATNAIPPKLPDFLAFVIPLSIALVFDRVLYFRVIEDKSILKIFVAFFIFSIAMFIFYKYSPYYSVIGGALHAIYYIVLLLPIVFILDKDVYKYLALLTVLILSVLSYKRGAIISVALISMVFVLMRLKEASGIKKIFNIALMCCAVVAIQYFYSVGGSDLEYTISRLENIEKDGGSGRDEIFSYFLEKIYNLSFVEHMFGNGAKSTSLINTLNGLTSHNDWIELYFDYGFFAFLLWGIYYVKNIKLCIRISKAKSKYAIMLASILFSYFVMSMVSHVMIYAYFSIVLIYLIYIKYKLNENWNSNLS